MKNKNISKTLLVGPRAHGKVSGVRMGFELLIDGFVARRLPFVIVDTSNAARTGTPGTFRLLRTIASLSILFRFYLAIINVERVYITISSSRYGFIRDALMIWPSWLLRRKLILHFKGGGYQILFQKQPQIIQGQMRKTLSLANKIIVLGDLLKEQFSFVPGIEEKIRVVPNGLPLELNPPQSTTKKLQKGKPIRLLYLSNLIETKGYKDVLRACAILHQQYQIAFKCDFCGEFLSMSGDQIKQNPEEAKSSFLLMVEQTGLLKKVSYRGIVEGKEKENCLRHAHVFILPTKYPWEGQPISIIEALAYGIPIITTRYRGIPEEVIESHNGFFVDYGEPSQIASAIMHIVSTPNLYDRLSKNAFSHYKENFTQDIHLENLVRAILN